PSSSHFSDSRESIPGAAGVAATPSPPSARTPSTRPPPAASLRASRRTMLILEIILLRFLLEPLDLREDRLEFALRGRAEREGFIRRLEVPVDPGLQSVVAADREGLLHGAFHLELAVARREDLVEVLVLDLVAVHGHHLERPVLFLAAAGGILDLAVQVLGDLGEDPVLAVGVLGDRLPDLREDVLDRVGLFAAHV